MKMQQLGLRLAAFACTAVLFLAAIVGLRLGASHKLATKTAGLGGLSREEHVDYLFIGSSLTRQSYDIRLIEQETGRSAYALGYNRLTPALVAELASYLCPSHAPALGKAIVELTPHIFDRGFKLEDERLFLDSPFALKLRLLQLVAASSPRKRVLELAMFSSNEVLVAAPFLSSLVDGRSYKGGYEGKIVPSLSREAFLSIREPPPQPLDRLPDAAAVLRSVQAGLERCGAQVVFLEPPIPMQRRQAPQYLDRKRALGEAVAVMGSPYVDFPKEVFDATNHLYFADSAHLSTLGRTEYSRLIASLIRDGTL